MASPIFVSRPHAGFSGQSFIRGIELALFAFFRSFTNPIFLSMGGLRELAKIALVSLLLNVSIDVVAKGFLTFGVNTLLSLPFLRVLELWLACACATSRILPEFERIFWNSLRDVSDEFEYLPSHYISSFNSNNTALRTFTKSKQRYVWACIALLCLAAVAASPPPLPHMDHVIYAVLFLIWANLSQPALGTWGSLSLAMLSSTLLYPATQILLISHVLSCRLLIQLLLVPYFSKIGFSHMEQVMWQRARGGVLWGYGIVFYALTMRFRFLRMFLIYVAEASAACLIAEVTEPLPPGVLMGTKAFSGWVARQVVWAGREQALRGSFDPLGKLNRQLTGSST